MRWRPIGAAVAIAVILAAGAGWWLWRQKRDREVLFDRLPGENVLLLYLDMDRLRHASALLPALRARVDPDPDYAAFVRQTGFDYERDLDRAAVCYLPDRVYVVARGRFDPARLRQYALAQGGSCAGEGLEKPCSMPASRLNRKISLVLISPKILALATAPEPDAVRQLGATPTPNALPLAQAAARSTDPAALLWATATPPALAGVLNGTTDMSPNLALFPRALAGADRVYLFVTDRTPSLEVSLQAVCRSENQAQELRRLLQGLNDFIGGMLRGPRSGEPAHAWGKVLATAAIRQEQSAVRATWMIDPQMLGASSTSP